MSTAIEINTNNLYVNGFIYNYPEDDELELLREILVIEPQEDDEWVTLTYNHTLDGLAYEKYSSVVADASKFWWVIADANNIYNPLDLSELVGTKIFIPNILRILMLL